MQMVADHLTTTKSYDAVELLTLPVPHMGKVIKTAADKCCEATDFDGQLEAQFITKQLLQLAQILDFADEAGNAFCPSAYFLATLVSLL
jgi:hypothetical protein